MRKFLEFIREQGVVGLAVGFMLGGAVSKVVASLVNDIINPLIGGIFGDAHGIKNAYIQIGAARITWGSFVSVIIDFLVIALVVYFAYRFLRLEKLDKKKK